MRISALNNYNTTPLNFSGKNNKKDNGMMNATKAMILATALSAVAPSCEDLTTVTHNHFVPLPVDTFQKGELSPTPIPPQVIFVEKEIPGKNDTIIIKDTVPQIVEKRDTIWETKYDTIKVPEIKTDTVWQTKYDTIKVPQIVVDKDTIWETKYDTIVVPEIKTDTIWQTKFDTVTIPEFITKYDTIFKTDTIVQPGDTIIKRDTVTLPGETIYVKEDWKSPVPPKQEEIYDRLGIETTGEGKFFLSTNFYDRKNSVLVTRNLNGMASSRDGKILVYNVIKTGWDHEAEGVTLGKNETFEKHLVYLSEDGEELGMKIMKPKVSIKPSDGKGKPNWVVFEKGTLSTPDAWAEETSFFATPKGGIIELSNGFSLKQGPKPQSVTKTNSYGSEWDLIDWNVVKGDPD
ncbi:hypothetical protein J6A31_01690 [bacterium]|nr:hypothetical protein [bacterium]